MSQATEAHVWPTVLIVEDEPFLADIYRRVLRLIFDDYPIVSVPTAAEALAYSEDHVIGLVITDYSLHPMNGITLTSILKKAKPSLPVVMITGADLTDIADKAYAAGVTVILHKPFPMLDLQTVARALLSEPGAP